MYVRAVKEFTFRDQMNESVTVQPGQLVDIFNSNVLDKLRAKGAVCDYRYSWQSAEAEPAQARARTMRVGIWLRTSTSYSGGRLHLYQYALTLAQAGAEVYLITDGQPRWATDYPACKRLHILASSDDLIPPDIDLIVTDSKGPLGEKALDYKRRHASIPFVCFNFETSNWVREYCPDYADSLGDGKWRHIFAGANLIVGNSELSLLKCIEWLGDAKAGKLAAYLPPAVNTHAIKQAPGAVPFPSRPFAVWSARPADHKCSEVAFDAVLAIDRPFDLVCLGNPKVVREETADHKWHMLGGISDAGKYALLRRAEMALAPSLFEGFGMVPGEALASGTPCVVFDLPVLRQNYGARLHYVKWGDKNAFVNEVSRLAGSGETVTTTTARKKWALETYGLPAMAKAVDCLPYHTLRRPRVSVQLICYATPTVFEAIESVYEHVDEIILAYGPTELWRDWPDNGMRKRIENYIGDSDVDGKIRLDARDVWPNKLVMRSYCAERAQGNRLLMLDADEIWVGLDKWLAADVLFGSPRWLTFWHDETNWIHDTPERNSGQRWGYRLEPFGSVCPHYRWSQWRHSYRFRTHPAAVDAADNVLSDLATNKAAAEAVPECVIYHLGHALPRELILRKHAFYQQRDGAPAGRHEAWASWDGKRGAMADGYVRPVTWDLPEIVTRAFERMREGALA